MAEAAVIQTREDNPVRVVWWPLVEAEDQDPGICFVIDTPLESIELVVSESELEEMFDAVLVKELEELE